jgi:rhodanese-related sulfurtransferase|tara:strand:+ start:2083 stop:2499 length:417 start_codon:yes stop_codon:yes gene_type:complete
VNIFIFVSQEWLLITFLFALIAALVAVTRKNNGLPIVAGELVTLMNQDKAVLVDVRSANDFKQGHIHGSINIPHNALASRTSELEKHKSSLIVLADQMGQHAGTAGGLLTKQGYDIRRLSGGISQWKHSNLPLVSGKK